MSFCIYANKDSKEISLNKEEGFIKIANVNNKENAKNIRICLNMNKDLVDFFIACAETYQEAEYSRNYRLFLSERLDNEIRNVEFVKDIENSNGYRKSTLPDHIQIYCSPVELNTVNVFSNLTSLNPLKLDIIYMLLKIIRADDERENLEFKSYVLNLIINQTENWNLYYDPKLKKNIIIKSYSAIDLEGNLIDYDDSVEGLQWLKNSDNIEKLLVM